MEHITVGRKYNEGKVAFVECVKDGSLDDINIKDKCFLLIVLTKGKLEFKVGGEKVTANAPSFFVLMSLKTRFSYRNQKRTTLVCTSIQNS